jgi:ornithine cyclodeaminase
MKNPIQTRPSTLFLSPQDVAAIIRRTGLAATLRGLTDYLQQDFLRWSDFD